MSNPTKLLGYHLRIACQSRQRVVNRALKQCDITHAQYVVMQYLDWAEGHDKLAGYSQNKIAQSLGLDSMMFSNILALLEKKNYLVRTKSGQGSQIVGLALTDQGRELSDQAHKIVVELEQSLCGDDESKKFKKILKKVVKNLE